MALYLKRLVSGNKARFRDDHLGLELDLAYVTDRVIVMGFPAVGVESLYRNRRADVQRFLSARHGSDFWVFNFCPTRENAYDDTVFDRRVSRYPFPDHHVPPILYLHLVTQEIRTWLSGSDARVVVLHCKAGKGRSGTLACAYLLSMPTSLYEGFSEWSLVGDMEGLQTPLGDTSSVLPDHSPIRPASVLSGPDLSRTFSEPNTLEKVLDLHASRRMKPARHRKPKMGVSIPSQQRWLSYWSQILAGNGPPSLGLLSDKILPDKTSRSAKVRLTKLTVRMREPSRMLVQAASAVITSAGKGRAVSQSTTHMLWASLARYSDRLVDELEKVSNAPTGTTRAGPFSTDRWDKAKMIRPFAQMSTSDIQPEPAQEGENRRPLFTYILRPLDEAEAGWVSLREPGAELYCENPRQSASTSSRAFVSSPGEDKTEDSSSIILEASRELRIKLFLGEITLGWVWLIPAFHMSSDSSPSSLVLSSDDIDFAIGIGKALVDLKISFAWHAHPLH